MIIENSKNPGKEKRIETNELRNALYLLHNSDYTPGVKGDPIELLNRLLNYTHSIAVDPKKQDTKKGTPDDQNDCNPICPSHKVFSVNLSDESKCTVCNKCSVFHNDKNTFVYEIFTWEILVSLSKKTFQTFKGKFLSYLHDSLINTEGVKIPTCICEKPKIKREVALNKPSDNIIFNFFWDMDTVSNREIWKFYNLLSPEVDLSELFKLPSKMKKSFHLYGMILFWGGHYTCAVKDVKSNTWVFCDDWVLKEFSSYKELIQNCMINYYTPITLFYSSDSSLSKKEDLISEVDYNATYQLCKERDKFQQKETSSDGSINHSSSIKSIRSFKSIKALSLMRKDSRYVERKVTSTALIGDPICPVCKIEVPGEICRQCGRVIKKLQTESALRDSLQSMNESSTGDFFLLRSSIGKTDSIQPGDSKEYPLNFEHGYKFMKSNSIKEPKNE